LVAMLVVDSGVIASTGTPLAEASPYLGRTNVVSQRHWTYPRRMSAQRFTWRCERRADIGAWRVRVTRRHGRSSDCGREWREHGKRAAGLPDYPSVTEVCPTVCFQCNSACFCGLRPRTLQDVSRTLIGHVRDTNWSMEFANVTDLSVIK
jgi:hypothetical protein